MERLRRTLDDQAGVITRRQALACGVTASEVRRLLRRRELVPLHRGVYLAHTGEPTWLQRAWAAVLAVGPAALAGEAALRAAEGPGRRGDVPICVAVDRSRRVDPPSGVALVRMTHLADRVLWNTGPPRLRYEEAALDVAAEAASDFAAVGVIAAAVQSRRTTAARMIESLAARQRSPRRAWLVGVLRDAADGTCSVLEIGYLRWVERAHGLPRARRQVRAVGTLGVTYRDAQLPGLVIELDGRLFHDTARQRDRDLDRDLDAKVAGDDTVRLGYGQVFDRACTTAVRLEQVFRARGWRGRARPCGPGCAVG